MVSTNKTIVSRSAYEAPACKLYSIYVESVIAASGDNPGGPGSDLGGGEEHDLD